MESAKWPMTKPGARWLRTVKPPSTAWLTTPSGSSTPNRARSRGNGRRRPGGATHRPRPPDTHAGRHGGEADEAGDEAVAVLDPGVGLERRGHAAVALGPVGPAEPRPRQTHGGTREDDQREGRKGDLGDPLVG